MVTIHCRTLYIYIRIRRVHVIIYSVRAHRASPNERTLSLPSDCSRCRYPAITIAALIRVFAIRCFAPPSSDYNRCFVSTMSIVASLHSSDYDRCFASSFSDVNRCFAPLIPAFTNAASAVTIAVHVERCLTLYVQRIGSISFRCYFLLAFSDNDRCRM